MRKTSVTLFLLCFTLLSSIGQTHFQIKGQILDPDNQPLAFANVLLYHAQDSSLVTMNYSETEGDFTLEVNEAHPYYIHVSYVGYQDYLSDPFVLSADNPVVEFKPIHLAVVGNFLKELVVTARRPLLEVKPDKTVVNVAGSINAAGNDALALLRKAPGVMVNQNEEISLLGKSGIKIYINGKKSPLSGDQLSQYLKSIPSEEIQKIEIISQPSAKYDAEGNAGIINIVLKKNLKDGHQTTLSLGYKQGQKSNYNGSLQSHWKLNQWNTYGSLNYFNQANPNEQFIYRAQNQQEFYQNMSSLSKGEGLNYKAGVDYDLSKNSVVSLSMQGGENEWDWRKTSRAEIYSRPLIIDSILISDGGNLSHNRNQSYHLNYSYSDKNETTFLLNADFGNYRKTDDQDLPNTYWDAQELEILTARNFAIGSQSDIEILTLNTDYETPLWYGKISAGAKWSHVVTDNDFNFFQIINDKKWQNFQQSNLFTYTEEVWAGYLSLSQTIDQWAIKGGVRMEHTQSLGDLTSIDLNPLDRVKQSYWDWFPSLGMTYTFNENHILQLNYSRRINRPNYKSLNPFEFRLDELTFQKGNPFLTPEYTNKTALGYTLMQAITTSIEYSHTSDMISEVVSFKDENSVFQTYQNIASQYDISWSTSIGLPINDWWTAYGNILLYHRKATGEIIPGQVSSIATNTFQVYSQQSFELPKKFRFEIDGFYQSPSAWGGQFIMKEMWGVNFGIQKKILNDQAQIKLSVSDIFRSMGWDTYSKVGDLNVMSRGRSDSQQIKLNFSYTFGNQNLKSRKRKTGNTKETQRL